MTASGQCERCREWVSVDLDEELSEFEGALLSRHLAACPSCRAFQRELRSLSTLLHSAPPAIRIELPVRQTGRQRRGLTMQRLAAGMAVAAAAVAAVFGSGLSGDQHTQPVLAVGDGGANVDLVSLRALQRAQARIPSVSLNDRRIRVIEID